MRSAAVFRLAVGFSAALLTSLGAGAAHAKDNDLVLSRLADAAGGRVVPNNLAFRSLVSQLGVALGPRFLTPADTLGYGGFQFTADLSFTTIDHTARYWCATEENGGACAENSKDSSLLGTFGLFARKGIWLPLPSFEVGAGAIHLASSDMWAAQAYAKFAVHEGFHDWPIPSLAARGAVSRLMGSEQLDLTIASLDVSVSKSFGVAGTFRAAPYAGWNVLWIIPRSEVIDKTPDVDAFDMPDDVDNNFVFPDQDNIVRQRLFGGLKLKYHVFALTAEAVYALEGSSVDDRAGTDLDCALAPIEMQDRCDATDGATSQMTYTVSVGMDF